ncbi:helix-turn-helix domain-containing protein [Spirosoma areae]
MEILPITFEQLPAAIYELGRKVDDLTGLLKTMAAQQHPPATRHFDVRELCAYLPDRPAVSSVYGLVQRGEIPFGRRGKKLIFYQPDIDLWLASKRAKTTADLSAVAEKYLSNRTILSRRKGGQGHV